MRKVLLALILVLGVLATPLPAQGKGLTIFKHSATQEQIIAGVRAGCPKTLFNVSCGEFLGMLQASDPEYTPLSIAELPAYIKTLKEGLCGEEKGILAGLFLTPTRAILFNEHRTFGPGERCLKTPTSRTEAVRNVMSSDCGNGNILRIAVEGTKMSLNVSNPFKDSLQSARDTIRDLKDRKQNIHIQVFDSVLMGWNNPIPGFIRQSTVVDYLGVSLSITVVPSRPVIKYVTHDSIIYKKSSPVVPFAMGLGVGVLAGGLGDHYWLDNDACTACPCTNSSGDPVNPKNRFSPPPPATGVQFGFFVRIPGLFHR